MAATRLCAIGRVLVVLLAAGVGTARAEGVVLREATPAGTTTRVLIELKAEGTTRPGPPPGSPRGAGSEGTPRRLKVETRFAFDERVLRADADGTARRAVRRAIQAAAAINAEARPLESSLRPEVALLIAGVRDGAVVVSSPGGPLTRPELELVQGPGDPLALPALLPGKPVSVGDRWTVGPLAARSLSDYDALAANGLTATLEALDDDSARVALSGTIRGAARGGEGTIACDGSFRFDRKADRIDSLTLTRAEARKPGHVEAGLEVKSTLTVERRGIETPPELTDDAMAGLPAEPEPAGELLLFVDPGGKYTLLHDRDWHVFFDDARRVVLKRLDHGELLAQCNLQAGPNAGKGRHQELGQFRDDIRRALGRRFGKVVEAGEVEGPASGGFRYRVAVRGQEGDVGILWYYYLIAGPEGDQLLVTFTLGGAQAGQFDGEDLRLVGALEWTGPAEAAGSR